MILGELLGTPVHDAAGHRVGLVVDVRFLLPSGERGPARVHGVLVGDRRRVPFLGFERSGARSPWPVAQWLRRGNAGAFLVRWADVVEVRPDRVVLARGARRWSTDLPERSA
ncbi:hypothetical protein [Actinotalea fermentans]|uniref:PRC-barrel domain-containing protein n=1 Tax=Actinotalea fermentans TaxID=43671 RepID=A0A511Z1K0_9CELL|nr:hypothetical protein [Actinotalea fermentans]KGM16530.1 hypothetical protein N867_19155 [Actinotalea fermentans ATCC 43279 = JCM 9966 = DSM 3133]GEN81328.1 hypothetical protein AFE02nite_30620 [Actinotalea fermentans]